MSKKILNVDIYFLDSDAVPEKMEKAISSVTGHHCRIQVGLGKTEQNVTDCVLEPQNGLFGDGSGLLKGACKVWVLDDNFPDISEEEFVQRASKSGIHVLCEGKNENPWDDTFWLIDYFQKPHVMYSNT